MQATDVTEVLSLSDKKWSLVPGVGGKAHKGITALPRNAVLFYV